MGQIYGIYSSIHNRIIYVGQTIKGYEYRFKRHLRECDNKTCKKIHKTINKYGKDNFKPILLLECETHELNSKEIKMIELYDTLRNGCNLTFGGETMSGYKHKQDTKEKIGKKLKERWENNREEIIESLKKRPPRKQSLEERRKKSEFFKETNPMHSEKVREKLSETCKKKYENGYTNPRSQKWMIQLDTGKVLEILDLKSYCRENNLKYNAVYSAWTRAKPHKNIIKIEKVENENI
jgi:group I intron endonuclease